VRLSLEMVTVPVADVDRAKAFYVDQVGFHEDMDVRTDGNRRFVRLTPPGSVCCVAIGEGWIDSAPGSLQGTQLVVDDVDGARAFLVGRGVEVTEVQEYPWGRFSSSRIRMATDGRCRSRPQRRELERGCSYRSS
jgi:catechol 2,3-dioxygenase-like lactoylglutathione lyase family enzyme